MPSFCASPDQFLTDKKVLLYCGKVEMVQRERQIWCDDGMKGRGEGIMP